MFIDPCFSSDRLSDEQWENWATDKRTVESWILLFDAIKSGTVQSEDRAKVESYDPNSTAATPFKRRRKFGDSSP